MEVQEFVSQNEPFIAASIAATAIAVAAAAFANASCQVLRDAVLISSKLIVPGLSKFSFAFSMLTDESASLN